VEQQNMINTQHLEVLFHDAGYRVFPLLPIINDKCACGGIKCAGKHPQYDGWQHTPEWSEEQFAEMDFSNGYGVLCKGLLVIDIDARNGGVKSYEKLAKDCPEITNCGFIVDTGSGGGSRHLYFKHLYNTPLKQHLKEYPGIDFKSTGYVVGPGSPHVSGNYYTVGTGDIGDIGEAPESILNLLKKDKHYRANLDDHVIDVTDNDIVNMLNCISPDCDYNTWITVGMAVHHSTGGHGQALWNAWSSKGDKYSGPRDIDYHWHSFGKCDNPVTLGTLFHYAEEGGYRLPVTSDLSTFPAEIIAGHGKRSVSIDTDGIDLLRPPGFVGKLAAWINTQCYYQREMLAVAAALQAVSNAGGMRYIDPLDGITPNLISFCVAGSGTGKESILKAFNALMKATGVTAAVYGDIKSEQEIYRNLTRHQAAYYVVDELGESLAKISSAMKRGGAVYLEKVIGALMSIFTKADSFALITGDLKEEIRQQLQREVVKLEKAVQENTDPDGMAAYTLKRAKETLLTIDDGIENPYLSILGFTTPGKFNELMDLEMATNGFIGRSLIFKENNDNPRRKPRDSVKKGVVPPMMRVTLRNLYNPISSDTPDRVEQIGSHKVEIPTRPDAVEALSMIEEEFWRMAEDQKEDTGLTPIPRRGYEMVAKVSTVLAMPGGTRTLEHVRWAYALVLRDMQTKIHLAYSNAAEDPTEALAAKILGIIDEDYGSSMSEIKQKCRRAKVSVEETMQLLTDQGYINMREVKREGGYTKKLYFLTNS
jgi:predicted transcriptional regulator